MTWDEFWSLNPYIINRIIDGYKDKQKETDFYLWLQGKYTYIAMSTVMANAFGKGKKVDYIEEPLLAHSEEKELTEEQKQVQRDLFMAQLNVMMANFEATNKKE